MGKADFWTKSFFLAHRSYHDTLQSPVVYDTVGEPLVRNEYNFIEYCARYADMCLEEYLSFEKRQGLREGG